MRDFYKKILSRTYEIFGVNQLEKMDDDQIKFLLDALESVSELYNYISHDNQQKIINKRMVTDREYRNINARLIAGWFELDGKMFFTQEAHKPSEQTTDEPLTGEAREKAINEFLAAIAKAETNFNAAQVKGNGQKLREVLDNNGIVKDKKVSALEAACGVTQEMKEKQNYPEI